MKKVNVLEHRGGIKLNQSIIGESIEDKVLRMVNNGEPMDSPEVDLIYTERKEGVLPQYDIRADKWDIAIESMDIANQSYHANRKKKEIKEVEDREPKPVDTSKELKNE